MIRCATDRYFIAVNGFLRNGKATRLAAMMRLRVPIAHVKAASPRVLASWAWTI